METQKIVNLLNGTNSQVSLQNLQQENGRLLWPK